MKIVFIFFPVLFCCALFFLWIMHSDSSPSDKKSSQKQNPEIIRTPFGAFFIYEEGVALNFNRIDKFRVSNPWPSQYEIRASIGWDAWIIKGGFKKREEAEEWLKDFLTQGSHDR